MEIPYWWLEAPLDEKNVSAPQTECDAVVVGAGYTGLSAAINLARAGKSVQVFDSLRPGEGASSRNGGIASGNLRYSLTAATDLLGKEHALAMFREGHQARADLAAFIRDENIDCDYQANGRFTGAINTAQLDFQKREAGLLAEHLDVVAFTVDRGQLHGEIGSDIYAGGLVREDLAMLHPGKFHAGMLRVAKAAGASVFGGLPVTDYVNNRGVFEISAGGRTIRAGQLIVATNGYGSAADKWLRRRLVPVVSRIVVTGEMPAELMDKLLPKRRAMGETKKMFRYYRPTPDGKRILLGSREKAFPASPGENAEHVFAGLLEIFPELEPYGYEYSWKGNVAFSRDELPGLFERDGIIYACGYCGSGVVWARWLGAKAAAKALGLESASTCFESAPPPFIPFYNGKPWFLPAFMGYYGWQDRRAERSGR